MRFSRLAAIIIQHCFILGITSLNVFPIVAECQFCSSASVVAHSGLSAFLATSAQPRGTCWHPQPWAGCYMPPEYTRSGYFLAQPGVVSTCARPVLS